MSENVKGVRDFIGREALLRQEVLETIRKTYELFGFEPIETPAFEPLSLFIDKSGPEIESQLYSFEDKKGEKLALRPEHTISKLRVVSKDKSLVFPLKAYSIGNVWRYEDVKKGRWREFIQADIDVFGSSSLLYDAEVIACIDFTIKKLGIKNYRINISNRNILTSLMDSLNVGVEDIIQVLREIDKIHKVGIDEVVNRISTIISKEKSQKIREYLEGNDISNLKGVTEVDSLIKDLKENYSVENTYFDRSLVRGQDYYDGTIFEFEFIDGNFKGVVLAGGGRYDKLSKHFDSDFQIVGGAIGFDVIVASILSDYGNEFKDNFCVINVDNLDKSKEVAKMLRNNGIITDIILDKVSLSKGLDYCNSKKIKFAIIVGNKDLEKGQVTIRNLQAKKDIVLDYDNLEKEIKKLVVK